MTKNKKAIIIGDNERAIYHPLKGPDKELAEILNDFEVVVTEDYDQFSEENLKQYDLCVSLTDCWNGGLTDGQTAGLISFVCQGGGLLIIHTGISIQTRYELAQLAGGKFSQHPEQMILTYEPAASNHIIEEGIGSFSVKEEPYQFIIDNLVETTVLLKYESEGKDWPAAWAHKYGHGRIVYLSPGHNIETFLDPMYREMIKRSGLWAAGML